MGKLENIFLEGNFHLRTDGTIRRANLIACRDGFRMSVVTGEWLYCTPRRNTGPYTAVEVGFPSKRPEPWSVWSEYAESRAAPTETVYPYVPVEEVRRLVESHGGEVPDAVYWIIHRVADIRDWLSERFRKG